MTLRLALPDDALRMPTLELLTAAGVAVDQVVVAAADVPTYLRSGAAELGVMSRAALLEGGAGLCELLDLGFGGSLLVFAAAPSAAARGERLGHLRIATRHPRLTLSYFAARGVQVAVVEVAGELDRAARDGLADGVVALVDAIPGAAPPAQVGGLDIAGVVVEGGAHLVASRGGRVLHAAEIGPLVARLRSSLTGTAPA